MSTTSLPAALRRVRSGEVSLETLAVNAVALVTARLHLRAFDRVGRFPRTRGKPIVDNRGSIEVGDAFQVISAFCPARFVTAPGGELRIGADLNANFGIAIFVKKRVVLGSRVNLGPYVVIADHDHAAPASSEAKPVVIGDDVWLAARVRVAPGVTIGSRTVVSAGSVVETSLPPNAVASGIPARVLRLRERGPS